MACFGPPFYSIYIRRLPHSVLYTIEEHIMFHTLYMPHPWNTELLNCNLQTIAVLLALTLIT